VSPIFVRPVREQIEHDRLIRNLQAKYKRKGEVAINVGDQQVAPVKIGPATFYPDLVCTDGKKLTGVIEVETGESVNNLEAMAQWVPFSRARAAFHLYVPVHAYDTARRLCAANPVRVTELWTYRLIGDQFDLVRAHYDQASAARSTAAAARSRPPAGREKPAARSATRPPKKAVRTAATPAAKAKPRPKPSAARKISIKAKKKRT
jgi:hypothetical protein